MHVIFIACIIGFDFIARGGTENLREQKHFRNCPVSILKNEFATRCQNEYPLEHFDDNFINNRTEKIKAILRNSKLEHNGCYAAPWGATEILTFPEDGPANLTCARFCPVTNDILEVFRNKR